MCVGVVAVLVLGVCFRRIIAESHVYMFLIPLFSSFQAVILAIEFYFKTANFISILDT